METGICHISIIPLRKDPSEKSEMVSQLLFGEAYEVTGIHSSWYKIHTEFDHYTGWIDKKLYFQVSEDYFQKLAKGGYEVSRSIATNLITPDNSLHTITAGCTLGYSQVNGIFEIDSLSYRLAEPASGQAPPIPDSLSATAKRFLNSPYLWGGRSPFGFDCSGFTQIVYKIHGMKLWRDASQQAGMGIPVNTLQESNEGDLVFFANEEDKVVHVGLALPPGKIIHCSGMVRIDTLDGKGIYNQQPGQYTHRLHSIRRMV